MRRNRGQKRRDDCVQVGADGKRSDTDYVVARGVLVETVGV
jgi:hypothetical protein